MSETLDKWQPIETIVQGSSFKRRVVLTPSIHIEETRTVTGAEIAGAELCPEERRSPGLEHRGNKRYAHRSLHVCPHTTTPPPFIVPTRNDPPDQSHFFATQQQDWDFWEKHRDLVFAGKGVHPADPIWNRVRALAEDIWTFRYIIQKPGGNDFSRECPWSSPTATLLYGSWCAGCAPALCAMCATVGVPARGVGIGNHMMAEAFIDDRWCLIDNITDLAEAGGNMMLRGGLAQVLLDPCNPKWAFIDLQKGRYWDKAWMTCSSSTGRFHEETGWVALTPQNALALYQGWADPRFKSNRERAYDLVWGRSPRSHPALILKQGQAFRRRFWVGSLEETEKFAVTFYGGYSAASDISPHSVPRDGGNWFIAVNDSRIPVKDLGGWDFHRQPEQDSHELGGARWAHRFEVPPAMLNEYQWNSVAIGSTGSGSEFLRFGGDSDWILPEETCWLKETC